MNYATANRASSNWRTTSKTSITKLFFLHLEWDRRRAMTSWRASRSGENGSSSKISLLLASQMTTSDYFFGISCRRHNSQNHLRKQERSQEIHHDDWRKSLEDASMDPSSTSGISTTSATSSTAVRDRDEWSWQHDLRPNNGGVPSVLSVFRKSRICNIQDSSPVGGWIGHHQPNVLARRKPPRWSVIMMNPPWLATTKNTSISTVPTRFSRVTDSQEQEPRKIYLVYYYTKGYWRLKQTRVVFLPRHNPNGACSQGFLYFYNTNNIPYFIHSKQILYLLPDNPYCTRSIISRGSSSAWLFLDRDY